METIRFFSNNSTVQRIHPIRSTFSAPKGYHITRGNVFKDKFNYIIISYPAANRTFLSAFQSLRAVLLPWAGTACTCWQKLLIAMQDGVFSNILVRIGAKDDADGRVITLAALQFVIHTNIHIHLTYVLMGNFAGFQIHQHKALKDIVVEHKVDIVVLFSVWICCWRATKA